MKTSLRAQNNTHAQDQVTKPLEKPPAKAASARAPENKPEHQPAHQAAYRSLCALLRDVGAFLPEAGNEPVRVAVALSGGKDSVGLLSALCRAVRAENANGGGKRASSARIALYALYVNHCAQEADEQRHEFETVQEVCRMLGVPLCAASLVTGLFAGGDSPKKISGARATEDALRALRYDALARMAVSLGCAALATAHHKRDVHESLLMRLSASGGWQGLAGIPPHRALKLHGTLPRSMENNTLGEVLHIVRPALEIMPEELFDPNLPFHQDKSNHSARHARNVVRHDIVPAIEAHFPQAAQAAFRYASSHAKVRAFVHSCALPWLSSAEDISYPFAHFCALPALLQDHVLYEGANAMGIARVATAFLDECRKSLLRDESSVRIGGTVLAKRGGFLRWSAWSADQTQKSEAAALSLALEQPLLAYPKNECYLNTITLKAGQSCMLQYEQGGTWRMTQQYSGAASKNDEHNPSAVTWMSEYRFSAQQPVTVRLLAKSDNIVQAGRAISAYDALASSCIMHPRNSIPVVLDAHGLLCAAGETLLARTICRSMRQDDEELSQMCIVPCIVQVAYGRMHILVQ